MLGSSLFFTQTKRKITLRFAHAGEEDIELSPLNLLLQGEIHTLGASINLPKTSP